MNDRTLRITCLLLLALTAAYGLAAGGRAHAEDGAANTVAQPVGASDETDHIKTRFIIDDADPEAHVPSAREAMGAPLQMGYWVMLVSDRALAAQKRGDLASTVKYFRAIAKAVPDSAASFSRVCKAYEAMGDQVNALHWCRAALDLSGTTIEDHAHFVKLLVATPAALSSAAIADADAVIAHLEREARTLASPGTGTRGETVPPALSTAELTADTFLAQQLRCLLGARLQDKARLAKCSSAMQALAPNAPQTLAFTFAYALMTQKLDHAQHILDTAKRVGLPESGVALMQTRLDGALENAPLWARLQAHSRTLAAGLLALGAACLAVALYLRRRSRPSVRRHASA